MTTDSKLLRRYAETKSEAAFAELVQRHVNLVHSAALRQVNGDAHLAQDVAQTVFTDLARKAASLSRRAVLTGWLYTSTHFAAAKAVRTENRRRDREEKYMREPTNENVPEVGRVTPCAPEWEKLRPVLDQAMHELKEIDREAILLRHFENRQFAEVGTKLGLNENAARMRVERALEKLRTILAKRGIMTAAALAPVISANAIQLAPANLATALTAASVAGAGTGTFVLLKIMTATQLKLGATALVVAGTAAVLAVQHRAQIRLRSENESLQQQMAQLKTENENLSDRLATTKGSSSFSDGQMNELLKLRGEVSKLRQQANELGKLQAENHQIRERLAATTQPLPSPEQDAFSRQRIQTITDAKMIGIAMRIWAGDNNELYPTNFYQMTNELGSVTNTLRFLETFELVNAGIANEHYPQMLVLREITPRQTPDGKWERVYGRADGSVQATTSGDGNFGAWEKAQQQYNPSPNQ